MTFGRSLILASLLCAPVLGCSDDETILALNVTLKPTATSARTLAVSITQPGQTALDTTVTIATKETDAGTVLKNDKFFERITLPGDIGGWLEGRSRFARLGLMIHVTSGFVQPGVSSRQVLEMSNVSSRTLLIHAGVRLLQIVLQRCEGNAVYQGRFARQDNL